MVWGLELFGGFRVCFRVSEDKGLGVDGSCVVGRGFLSLGSMSFGLLSNRWHGSSFPQLSEAAERSKVTERRPLGKAPPPKP